MMNEFPGKYKDVMAECSGTTTPAVNVTEYLEYLDSLGVKEEDYPAIQPIHSIKSGSVSKTAQARKSLKSH